MLRRSFLIVIFLGLAACTRVEPIQDIHQQAIATGSGKTPTASEVRAAIVQAAAEKTWVVKDIDATHLGATLHIRSHTAKVTIQYSPKAYSITYEDSDNLRHKGNLIHRRYNDWVKGLSITINRELARL